MEARGGAMRLGSSWLYYNTVGSICKEESACNIAQTFITYFMQFDEGKNPVVSVC